MAKIGRPSRNRQTVKLVDIPVSIRHVFSHVDRDANGLIDREDFFTCLLPTGVNFPTMVLLWDSVLQQDQTPVESHEMACIPGGVAVARQVPPYGVRRLTPPHNCGVPLA